MKFHQNPSSGSRAVPRGETGRRTDMTELIVAFQDFANAPKNQKVNSSSEIFTSHSTTKCRGAQFENQYFGTLPGYFEELHSNRMSDNVIYPICQPVHISESTTILLWLVIVQLL
jgi:hypothetical protein